MQKPLTELERNVLDYLFEYLRSNTYQPSIREIGTRFGIKSTKTVSELLQSLADKGWIERDPSRSRGVRLLGLEMAGGTVAVPLLGGAEAAHLPFQLDDRLVGPKGALLAVMQGDHLLEHGISPGDLLLVEPADPAGIEDGDIVMASIGGLLTARRCARQAADLVLEPISNGEVSTNLTPRQAASALHGRVTAVVRRLRPVSAHATIAVPAGT
ncbi:MAG: S24 family peptidase [Gemmatimonadota bacterium]